MNYHEFREEIFSSQPELERILMKNRGIMGSSLRRLYNSVKGNLSAGTSSLTQDLATVLIRIHEAGEHRGYKDAKIDEAVRNRS